MPPDLYHPLTFLVSALLVLWCTPLDQTHDLPMVPLGGVSIWADSAVALLAVWRLGGVAEAGGGVLPVGKEYEIWGVTIAGPDRSAAGISRTAARASVLASRWGPGLWEIVRAAFRQISFYRRQTPPAAPPAAGRCFEPVGHPVH